MIKTHTLQEMDDFYKVLTSFKGKSSPRFQMALRTNRERLTDLIKGVVEQYESCRTPEFTEFEEKREAVYTKYRKEMNLPFDSFEFGENNFKLEEEVLEISTHYKDAIKEFSDSMVDFEKMMMEEVEVNIHMVGMDVYPKTTTIVQFLAFKPMIKKPDNYGKGNKIETIDIVRNDVYRIVNLVTDPNVNFSFRKMSTPFCRRIATFMEQTSVVIKKINELKKKHYKIPEFVEFQQKRMEILRDPTIEDTIHALNEHYKTLPKKVADEIKAIDTEMEEFGAGVIQITMPKIRLEHIDFEMDDSVFDILFPLIQEPEEDSE